VCETRVHEHLREAVHAFWSGEGAQLLAARFGHESSCSQQSAASHQRFNVLPTHVTERRAPPDAMRIAHIDYPPSIDLGQLASEWWSRWRLLRRARCGIAAGIGRELPPGRRGDTVGVPLDEYPRPAFTCRRRCHSQPRGPDGLCRPTIFCNQTFAISAGFGAPPRVTL